MSRRAKLLELDGELHTVTQWARIYNLNRDIIFRRLSRGWDLRAALTTPLNEPRQKEPPSNGITEEDKRRCLKCYYCYGELYGGDIGCRYILDTGHRRPCPAHNCKVFIPLKGRRPAEPVTIIHKWEGVEAWI